jgi:hypothetical protein
MGILPAANYFQKTMSEDVLAGFMYTMCEDYIDDLLIAAKDDPEFMGYLKVIFQRLRDKNVTLNPKKVKLGASMVQFIAMR